MSNTINIDGREFILKPFRTGNHAELAQIGALVLVPSGNKKEGHTHKFTVPVESKYNLADFKLVIGTKGGLVPIATGERVTKLRCSECPEEISR
jgi:hypothetical protein